MAERPHSSSSSSDRPPADREIPVIAIYRDGVVELNATDGDELDAYFAKLATSFIHAAARPETRT